MDVHSGVAGLLEDPFGELPGEEGDDGDDGEERDDEDDELTSQHGHLSSSSVSARLSSDTASDCPFENSSSLKVMASLYDIQVDDTVRAIVIR